MATYYIVLINSQEDIFGYISGHAVLDEDNIKIEQKYNRPFDSLPRSLQRFKCVIRKLQYTE